jgi:hypothetical protein
MRFAYLAGERCEPITRSRELSKHHGTIEAGRI